MNPLNRTRQTFSSGWMRLALIVLVAASSTSAHDNGKPAFPAKNTGPLVKSVPGRATPGNGSVPYRPGTDPRTSTPGGHRLDERHGNTSVGTVGLEKEIHRGPEGQAREARAAKKQTAGAPGQGGQEGAQ